MVRIFIVQACLFAMLLHAALCGANGHCRDGACGTESTTASPSLVLMSGSHAVGCLCDGCPNNEAIRSHGANQQAARKVRHWVSGIPPALAAQSIELTRVSALALHNMQASFRIVHARGLSFPPTFPLRC